MAITYNKLFKLMIDKKITSSKLASESQISLNIITRLRRNQYVSLKAIEKICKTLDCSVDDILEFTEENEL